MEIIKRLNVILFSLISIISVLWGILFVVSEYPDSYLVKPISQDQTVVKNASGQLFDLDKKNLQKAIDDGFLIASNDDIYLYDSDQKKINNENKRSVIFSGIGIPFILIISYYLLSCLIHYIFKGSFSFLRLK